MKKGLLVFFAILLIAALLASCAPMSESLVVADTDVAPVADATSQPEVIETFTVYAPVSTSSIPVIIAVQQLSGVNLVLYTDQSQANAQFIRGEAEILVSGLSVGVDMYRNGVPVQVANSFVSGLSYLVTYGETYESLQELTGKSVYVPFEGSPIDQVMQYLVTANGLEWKTDVTPVYAPFESSIALLKEGKLDAVVLPEPSVSLVSDVPNVYVSLDLAGEWDEATGVVGGYPQVASFVSSEWSSAHVDTINAFNQALQTAILQVEADPSAAVDQVKEYFKIPAEKLTNSLSRTRYSYVAGEEMQSDIELYYAVIGVALDESFKGFYFIAAH